MPYSNLSPRTEQMLLSDDTTLREITDLEGLPSTPAETDPTKSAPKMAWLKGLSQILSDIWNAATHSIGVTIKGSSLTYANRVPAYLVTSTGNEMILPGIGSIGDGVTMTTAYGMYSAASGYGYNGASWDRWRNNTEGTLLASAARTATTTSPNQTNYNARGVLVVLNVTAVSGTGGLTLNLQAIDPVAGSGYDLFVSSVAATATGVYVYEIYPGASVSPSGGWGVKQSSSGALPRTWRVRINHGDSSSYTYSVGYSLIV